MLWLLVSNSTEVSTSKSMIKVFQWLQWLQMINLQDCGNARGLFQEAKIFPHVWCRIGHFPGTMLISKNVNMANKTITWEQMPEKFAITVTSLTVALSFPVYRHVWAGWFVNHVINHEHIAKWTCRLYHITSLTAGKPRNRGSISSKAKWLFTSTNRPGWFWDPHPSQLLKGQKRRFPFGGKGRVYCGRGVTLSTHLYLVLRLRIGGVIPTCARRAEGQHEAEIQGSTESSAVRQATQ
jgi:hypothetical protein